MVVFCFGLLYPSCGSDDSTTTPSTNTTTENTFALSTYPTDFALVSPVAQSSSTSLHLASTPSDYLTKKAEIKALLEKTSLSDCTFALDQTIPNSPACYGPSLDYESHPDFSSGGGGSEDGNLPSGDLGIWTQYASSDTDTTQESCVSAKVNSLIGQAEVYVGNAEKAMAFLQCIAKNTSGVSLPSTVGDSVDLLEEVADAAPDANFTFNSAIVTYTSDFTKADETSSPIYTTTLSFENSSEKITYTINLKHTTTDTTNSFYKGKLWVYAVPSTGNTSLTKTAAYSVIYEKSSSTNLTYSMRNGNFESSTTESNMFDSDKTVKVPTSNDGYSWGIFSINPSDGTGKLAYAWVAGTTQENARSFLASVSETDSTKSGVGYFGFGDSMDNIISEYTNDGTLTKFLDRMICNWAGPSNNRTGVSFVQKQLIEQDSSSGLFKPTSSNITYIPRNSCGMGDGEDNSAFKFRTANSSDAFTNFGSPNLVSITSEKAGSYADTFNIPSPPSEFE